MEQPAMLILPKIFADLVDRMVVTTIGADGNAEEHDVPVQFSDAPLTLPTGMRALLLAILSAGYPEGAAQTQLANAPDEAIAWQVQSMLDDYADADALQAFRAAA